MAQALKKITTPVNDLSTASLVVLPPPPARSATLDQVRGAAVMLMMIYHFFYDVSLSYPQSQWFGWAIKDWDTSVWYWGSAFIGALFYVVAGVSVRSLTLKTGRERSTPVLLRKALKLGFFAALVSVGSYFFARENFIFFGTLHCLALATAFMPLFLRAPRGHAIIGAGLVFLFWALSDVDFYPYIGDRGVFLGLLSTGANYGGDYFPLMPWLGVMLIGFGVGAKFPRGSARIAPLEFLGKHALAIYLLHQPLLLAVMPYLKF